LPTILLGFEVDWEVDKQAAVTLVWLWYLYWLGWCGTLCYLAFKVVAACWTGL